MNKNVVDYTLDLENLPELTQQQKAEIHAPQDNDIDTSDIPPLSDDFWASAVQNPFYKPTKKSTTVRLDADILLWLKSKGSGYQTRLNAILREAMLKEIKR